MELISLFVLIGQNLDVVPDQHTEPFPSGQFALLYAFHHSTRPLICYALEMSSQQSFVMYYTCIRNVKSMCHIIKRDNPSLYELKKFTFPGCAAPSLLCVIIKCVCMLVH